MNSIADTKSELDALPSKNIVLMDYNSGKVLYQKDANSKIYPASTTKIWTAFCVLKKCKNLNQEIEVKDMPAIEGSSMYLENGEKFTVLELLEALLIHSSNDVAYLLAYHFGDGNVANFINYMNEEAKKYGATHTHFNNPHGLPDINHYTSAMDMVNLSRAAFGNDVIRKIVCTTQLQFKKGANCKLDREMFNTNKFLSSSQTIDYKGKTIPIKYDIVDGIKTGFTDDAGNCLVSTAHKNGIRLICGVFGAPGGSLYHDSRMVLDYGFDEFKNVTLYKKDQFHGEKKVRFATPCNIKYSIANDYIITVPKNTTVDKSDYKTKLDFDNLKMPVKKGDIIGTLNIYDKGNMVSSIGLVAENESKTYLQYLKDLLPFGKDEDNSKAKDESKDKNKEQPKEDKLKDKDDKKDDGIIKKAENKAKKASTKAQDTIKDSYNGFLAIFSGIGDSIKSFCKDVSTFFDKAFSSDGIRYIKTTGIYKFLDKKVSSMQHLVPSELIIFGVPILILLIILLLVIGIIKDSIKKRRHKKEDYIDEADNDKE